MASNVLVIPRFRPLNKRELSESNGADIVVEFEDDHKALSIHEDEDKKHRFTFDWVFPPTCTQEEVFTKVAEPLLVDVFNGFNTTIFAYGQTGSGKSHSMTGKLHDQELRGIIPRMVEGIFKRITESIESGGSIEFTIKVSFVEIYNEQIRDLCDIRKDKLKLRESSSGVWIEDVTETYVTTEQEVYDVMDSGNSNRAISATKMNAESSRSHSVFIITIGQRDTTTNSKKGAKLTLVDLAGSEKVGKTGAEGATLKEAQHINKSLSALGNVINALTSQPTTKGAKPLHVPYRDSKLTYLLSDSLGGNSKTLLIITGSPSKFNVDETLSTIRFGNRAKNIKNKPKANQERTAAEYKKLLDEATASINEQKKLFSELDKATSSYIASLATISPSILTQQPVPIKYARRIAELVLKLNGNQDWITYASLPSDDLDLTEEQEQKAVSSPLSLSVASSTPVPELEYSTVSTPTLNDSMSMSMFVPMSPESSSQIDSKLVTEFLDDLALYPSFAEIINNSLSQRDALFSISSASKTYALNYDNLENQLNTVMKELEKTKKELEEFANIDSLYKELQQRTDELTNTHDALLLEHSKLSDILQQKEEELDIQRKHQITIEQRHNTTVSEYKSEVEQLISVKNELKNKITILNQTIAQSRIDSEQIGIEKSSIEGNLNRIQKEMSELQENIANMKIHENKLEDDNSLLQNQLSEMKAKIEIYELARSQYENVDGDEDIEPLDDEDDSALGLAQKMAREEMNKNKHLAKQYDTLQEKFEESVHQLTAKAHEDLTNLRAEYEKKIEQKEKDYQLSLENTYNQHQTELSTLKKEHSKLVVDLETNVRTYREGYLEKIGDYNLLATSFSLLKNQVIMLEQELFVKSHFEVETLKLKQQLQDQDSGKDILIKKLQKKLSKSQELIQLLAKYGIYWKNRDRYSQTTTISTTTNERATIKPLTINKTGQNTVNRKIGTTSALPPKPSNNKSRETSHGSGGKINPKFDLPPKSSGLSHFF